MWQFPHYISTLDGKHIFFSPPYCDGSKYYNYKEKDSIILALVDADYKFIFVDIDKNDRTHDFTVFCESPLGIKLKENILHLPQQSILPGFNYRLPYIIVSDNAFPLHISLL